MARIGILGGTFNPVHEGHAAMARNALDGLELDQVMFIPCANPPHKESPELAPAEDRLAMLRIVAGQDERLTVSDMEIVRGGISYSIQTVKQLTIQFAGAKLVFITGTDSLRELHMWKDVDELLTLCEFRTFERPGCPVAGITAESLQLDHEISQKLLEGIVTGHPVDVSSSQVRKKVAAGESIEGLVDPGVERYIREQGLYQKSC